MAVKYLANPLYISKLHKLFNPLYSGLGQILMFHRVLPDSNKLRVHNHKSLEITPQKLESIIQFYLKSGFKFISIEELRNFNAFKNEDKFVILTFDDGYVDNLTYAYPIFKRYNIPFTIYVATSLPDGNALLWWYLLEDLVVEHSSIELFIDGKTHIFPSKTIKEKEISFIRIRAYFAKADKNQLKNLSNNLFGKYSISSESKTRSLSLTWDQLRELNKDPLVTIGSHTVNHLPLASLSYEDSKYEITQSKHILESELSIEIRHFCYPIGSYSHKEIKIVGESGYKTATTINMSNIFEGNFNYPFSLPRIMVNSLTDQKILEMQVSGLLPALRNRFRRVVV
jgi:peptidoglycan/xylan/chitin deacetylase (PgdA/CDA1 family)